MAVVSNLFHCLGKLIEDSSYVVEPCDKFTVELFRLLRTLSGRQALNLKNAIEFHLRCRFDCFTLRISEKEISEGTAKELNDWRLIGFPAMTSSMSLTDQHINKESPLWAYEAFVGISLVTNILDTYSKLASPMLEPLTTFDEVLDVADLQKCLCLFRNSLLGLEIRRYHVAFSDRILSFNVPAINDYDLEDFIPCVRLLLHHFPRELCKVFESRKTAKGYGKRLSFTTKALKEMLEQSYRSSFVTSETIQGGLQGTCNECDTGIPLEVTSRNLWSARQYLYCNIDRKICFVCESSSASEAVAVDIASNICQFCQCRHAVIWCDVKESLSKAACRHQGLIRLLEGSLKLLHKSNGALPHEHFISVLQLQRRVLFDGARRMLSAILSIERLMLAWPKFCRWPAILAIILQDKPAVMTVIISLEKGDRGLIVGKTFKPRSVCLVKAKDKLEHDSMSTLNRWVEVAKSELAYLQLLQQGQT